MLLPPIRCLAVALLFALPALAQKIVFESTRDGNFEIYSMNADGSGVTNLTNNPGIDRVPQWSPDGTKIAFVFQLNQQQVQDVVVIDAVGSGLVNLTKDEEFSSAAFPQWSPDGTKIAYNSNLSGNQQIHIMNADGTDRLQKTSEGLLLSDARWSPSGSHIVYSASRAQKESIIAMDTVDFNKTNLTLDLDQATDPRWSPDGSRIAFTSRQFGDRDIYVMNADGSGKVNLTSGAGDDKLPVWSPDGMRILFSSATRDGNEELYSINVNGSGLKNLSNHTSDDGFAQWSPDGSRIVFSSNRDGGDLELYMMNADGTNQTRLTNAAGNDISPKPFGNFSFGQPPAIFAGGVVLANLAPKVETISPLSIVSIFGMDFSSETLIFPNLSDGKIDTILGGTCVEIGGERSPIFAMTPTQANVQTPATQTVGPVGVVVIRDCNTPLATRSNVEMVTIAEATPGFFIFNPVAANGFIAARFNEGFAAVAPDALFTDEFGPSRPAKAGDIVLLFGTGWGPTDANLATGELASGAAQVLTSANPTVTLDGIPLAPEDVFYVGVTPNTAGLFQLAIRIPEGTTPGNKQVVLTVYGKSTPLGPVIPVTAP